VDHKEMTLKEISHLIADRLGGVLRRNEEGKIPAFVADSPFQSDPHWRELLQFHEYFHAETGQGLGAAHQTGWTGLMANLVMRRYRRDIPEFWRRQRAHKELRAVNITVTHQNSAEMPVSNEAGNLNGDAVTDA
jgi:hypothetical protein